MIKFDELTIGKCLKYTGSTRTDITDEHDLFGKVIFVEIDKIKILWTNYPDYPYTYFISQFKEAPESWTNYAYFISEKEYLYELLKNDNNSG
jgi:hypothetical protein